MMIIAMSAMASAQPDNGRIVEGVMEEVRLKSVGDEGMGEQDFKPLELIENNQTNMSETAQQKLLQIANNFRERNREMLNCTGDCYYQARSVGENETEVSENKPVRILGIESNARRTYKVDDEGDLISQRQNFAEFLRGIGLARQVASEESGL